MHSKETMQRISVSVKISYQIYFFALRHVTSTKPQYACEAYISTAGPLLAVLSIFLSSNYRSALLEFLSFTRSHDSTDIERMSTLHLSFFIVISSFFLSHSSFLKKLTLFSVLVLYFKMLSFFNSSSAFSFFYLNIKSLCMACERSAIHYRFQFVTVSTSTSNNCLWFLIFN